MAIRAFAGVSFAALILAMPALAQTTAPAPTSGPPAMMQPAPNRTPPAQDANQGLTPGMAARPRPPAQPQIDTPYNPRETFAPRPYDQPVNVYRSSNGLPGPDY